MGGTFAVRARLRYSLHVCLGSLTRAEWGARQSMIFRPVFGNITLYLPAIPCNPHFEVRGWLVFIVFWVFGAAPRGFLVSSQFVAKSNSIFSKPLSYQVVCFKKLLVCFSFSDEWAIDADFVCFAAWRNIKQGPLHWIVVKAAYPNAYEAQRLPSVPYLIEHAVELREPHKIVCSEVGFMPLAGAY